MEFLQKKKVVIQHKITIYQCATYVNLDIRMCHTSSISYVPFHLMVFITINTHSSSQRCRPKAPVSKL